MDYIHRNIIVYLLQKIIEETYSTFLQRITNTQIAH